MVVTGFLAQCAYVLTIAKVHQFVYVTVYLGISYALQGKKYVH